MEPWREDLYEDELYHHGVKGMHWGVRRYQNPDGSLTSAGKKRYSPNSIERARANAERLSRENSPDAKRAVKEYNKLLKERDKIDRNWAEVQADFIIKNNKYEHNKDVSNTAKGAQGATKAVPAAGSALTGLRVAAGLTKTVAKTTAAKVFTPGGVEAMTVFTQVPLKGLEFIGASTGIGALAFAASYPVGALASRAIGNKTRTKNDTSLLNAKIGDLKTPTGREVTFIASKALSKKLGKAYTTPVFKDPNNKG